MDKFDYTFSGSICDLDQAALRQEFPLWRYRGIGKPRLSEKFSWLIGILIFAVILLPFIYHVYTGDHVTDKEKILSIIAPGLFILISFRLIKIWLQRKLVSQGHINGFSISLSSSGITVSFNGRIHNLEWKKLTRCYFTNDCLIIVDNLAYVYFLPLRMVGALEEDLRRDVLSAYTENKPETFISNYFIYKSDLDNPNYMLGMRDLILKSYKRNNLFMWAGISTLFLPLIMFLLAPDKGSFSVYMVLMSFLLGTIPGLCLACVFGIRHLNGRIKTSVDINKGGLKILLDARFEKTIPWTQITKVTHENGKLCFNDRDANVCALPSAHILFLGLGIKYADPQMVINAIQKWRRQA